MDPQTAAALLLASQRDSQTNRSGSSTTHGQSSTENWNQSHEDVDSYKVAERGTLGEKAETLPDPGPYQMQPWVRPTTFSDMIKHEKDRKAASLQANLDQQDLQRRRARYLAWTDFGKALGQLHGVGYAPTKEMDQRKTLDAFKTLDALRNEYAAIAADDNLSWIQKLAWQSELEHQAAERAKMQKREDERLKIAHWNQEAHNKLTDTYTSGMSSKDRYSQGGSQTQFGSTTASSGTSNTRVDTSIDPNVDAMKARLRANGSIDKPIGVYLGTPDNAYYPTVGEAYDMATRLSTLIEQVKKGNAVIVNGNYVTSDGVAIPKDKFDANANQLKNIAKAIMGAVGDGSEASLAKLGGYVKELDESSDYAYRNYFRTHGGRGQSVGGGVKPAFSFGDEKPNFSYSD